MQRLSVAVDTHRQHTADGLTAVLDAARGLSVVVVGDVLLDEYLHGAAARVAREAPVPAVAVSSTEAAPGGAGNVAANLAALGATVELLAVVGDDEAGRQLLDALAGAGVRTHGVVVEEGRRTVVERRLSPRASSSHASTRATVTSRARRPGGGSPTTSGRGRPPRSSSPTTGTAPSPALSGRHWSRRGRGGAACSSSTRTTPRPTPTCAPPL